MNREKLRTSNRRAPRSLLLLTVALVASAGLLITQGAQAGPVRGTLRVPDREAAEGEGPPAYYWKAWNGFLEPREPKVDPRRELTVVLTGEGPAEPIGCQYRISGGDLLPRSIVAKAGASIRIENRDGCSHELQSEDIEGFAPLATAPGNARAFSAPSGGPHVITDRLYGHIEGWIVGLDDLVACAEVDAEGKYVFENVPSGAYTLKVFRDGEEVASQDVTAGDAPLTIDPLTLE